MKKLLIILISLIALILSLKPFVIKVINEAAEQCAKDMIKNEKIICD